MPVVKSKSQCDMTKSCQWKGCGRGDTVIIGENWKSYKGLKHTTRHISWYRLIWPPPPPSPPTHPSQQTALHLWISARNMLTLIISQSSVNKDELEEVRGGFITGGGGKKNQLGRRWLSEQKEVVLLLTFWIGKINPFFGDNCVLSSSQAKYCLLIRWWACLAWPILHFVLGRTEIITAELNYAIFWTFGASSSRSLCNNIIGRRHASEKGT